MEDREADPDTAQPTALKPALRLVRGVKGRRKPWPRSRKDREKPGEQMQRDVAAGLPDVKYNVFYGRMEGKDFKRSQIYDALSVTSYNTDLAAEYLENVSYPICSWHG